IFALTALLERYGMEVISAESGGEAIALLESETAVDVALVDVMMPEFDGFDTMRSVRAMPAHAQLPIIAVTAKAMPGDRERCLEAGATDYIAKPVDADTLLSMLRTWLYTSVE